METFLQQLINGLSLGAIYALIALGYTMVYGVLRLINFAHGDVYMLGAFVGYYLANALDAGRRTRRSSARSLVTLGAMAICARRRHPHRAARLPARAPALAAHVAHHRHRRLAAARVRRPGRVRRRPAVLPADDPRRETYSLGGVQITNQSLLIIVVVGRADGRPRSSSCTGRGSARRCARVSFNLSRRQADGHQHRPRHLLHVRARLGARRGGRRAGRRSRFRRSIR